MLRKHQTIQGTEVQTRMCDGHLGLDLNGRRLFRLVSNGKRWTFETSDVTWSQVHPGQRTKMQS